MVEGKQKFIGQVMTSKAPARSAEDIDETALSYAEVKALCTGNPYIKEKMDLDIAVQRLKMLKASHLSQRYALEDKIAKAFPDQIAALEQKISGYKSDSPTVVVAPLTSNIRKNILPTHVHVGRESGVRPSLVLLEQLRTVDKCRLGDKIGHVNKSVMRRVDAAAAISLGLRSLQKDEV